MTKGNQRQSVTASAHDTVHGNAQHFAWPDFPETKPETFDPVLFVVVILKVPGKGTTGFEKPKLQQPGSRRNSFRTASRRRPHGKLTDLQG